ncbi:zinc ribbon domain-containing protein [Methanobrevibacter sp.]|uniref:zinc ribbon domain-containing protein n=1 Tax=Methanobrevibacter sp. TaxID=66852 RepID=UPI00386731F7
MVKCPRCGYDNSPTSMYCDNCAYLLADPNSSGDNRRPNSWSMGIAKKIFIILGIIIIALLLFSFISNGSQQDSQSSLNVITDNGSLEHTSSYPYVAVIKYNGTWYSKMGDPNYLVERIGYGTEEITLDCASWDKVYIQAQKDDYGEGELSIQLLRNGKVVAENSTTNATGKISVSYNYN